MAAGNTRPLSAFEQQRIEPSQLDLDVLALQLLVARFQEQRENGFDRLRIDDRIVGELECFLLERIDRDLRKLARPFLQILADFLPGFLCGQGQ